VSYAATLAAAGGVPPVTWTIADGTLPAGLALDSGTGGISGTPGATGASAFVVLATDAASDTASRPLAITIEGVPGAVGDLAAAHLTSGNDADGTTRIQVTFTPTTFAATAEVYRAPFGGYPRYDDAGGFIPPTPSYPPGPPWVLTAVTASGQTDEPSNRDAWSYVVFLKNASGAVSDVSNKTAPTTNYALGDVSNGVTAGVGDNQVNDVDVSLLGAHYGISGSAITSAGVSYLDVGPTTDLALTSRPFTDNRIDFEDLIVVASNYGQVSSPAAIVAGADAMRRAARGPEQLTLAAPAAVEAGESFTATVHMRGEGRAQGLSVALAWDATVAEPLAVASAGWLEAQKGVVLSPGPGVVDAALLGVRPTGISGEGALATVTFRAVRSGDPQLHFGRVLARDAANRPLPPEALVTSDRGDHAATPAHTALLAPAPNPAAASAAIAFTLAQPGRVELEIYSVTGRRVRTLASGELAAGAYTFTWAGDDESHRAVSPGVYFARLTVHGGPRLTRTLVHF
jgi:hypothetical protein